MASESSGCSITRSRGRLSPSRFPRTTIHCFALIAGERTFECSVSIRSKPFPHATLAHFRRATDRNHPARISGSDLVLEPDRPRTEARRLQDILQPISVSYGTGRSNAGTADWRVRATARALRLLSVATALQWIISDPSRRLSWNPTQTGRSRCLLCDRGAINRQPPCPR
jgi:hypothetical protein